VGKARHEVGRLRTLTTGGIGSRWLGVPALLLGVSFSTWPDGWATVWPVWLTPAVLGFLVTCCAATGLYVAIEVWLQRNGPPA
jgi:hypothetical protein